MNPRPPIRTPPAILWREFRIRILPYIAFAALVVITGFLWWRVAPHSTLVGVGEGPRSLVTAPQPAIIKQLLVAPYTVVAQGTPIAVLVPMDVGADFDLLRSYYELARAGTQPSLAEENAMNFERIRVELLRTRAELAIAEVKVQQAERDVARNTPLYREKLVPEDIYELSVNTRDALAAEVFEKGKAVAEIERRLEHLRGIGEPDLTGPGGAGREVLDRLERAHAAAASNLAPITLVAPITGMVGYPMRQPGEHLVEGEPLMTISALRAERIVGYLRQPYVVDPEAGMAVHVATKTRKRQVFDSHIIQVGAQVEAITNSLGFIRQDTLLDSGLPVIVAMPNNVHIRPGELVDVTIRSGVRVPNTATPGSAASPNHPASRPRL